MAEGGWAVGVTYPTVIKSLVGLAPALGARTLATNSNSTLPLPHLLIRCRSSESTGILTLDSGRSVRTIFFRDGAIVWAESSERAETFVEWLVESRRISVDSGVRTRRLVRDGACRVGEALVRDGGLGVADVRAAAAHFVIAVVTSAFSWRDGTYRFAEADCSRLEPPVAGAAVDPAELVVEGFRAMKEFGLPTLWLGDLAARRMLVGDPYQIHGGFGLTPREADLLRWLSSGGFSVIEAVETGLLEPQESLRVLALLDALGLLGTI